MLNIVVPLAGRGSRFLEAGYRTPKPLIEVHGVPMLRLVVENIRPAAPHRFIFVCLREHALAHDLRAVLSSWAPGAVICEVDGVTAGAACTVLAARDHIDGGNPLMIANSDQFVDFSVDRYLRHMEVGGYDGLIATMEADDAKWSFVALADGLVTRAAEKEPISRTATVGLYNFRAGGDFVAAADAMIAAELRVNGEFYVAPVFNQLIARGRRIGVYGVGGVNAGMYGLGTPEDLEAFIKLPISRAATHGFQ